MRMAQAKTLSSQKQGEGLYEPWDLVFHTSISSEGRRCLHRAGLEGGCGISVSLFSNPAASGTELKSAAKLALSPPTLKTIVRLIVLLQSL